MIFKSCYSLNSKIPSGSLIVAWVSSGIRSKNKYILLAEISVSQMDSRLFRKGCLQGHF